MGGSPLGQVGLKSRTPPVDCMVMESDGAATLDAGTPVARRAADRLVTVDVVGPAGPDRPPVLRWSGPDGWRRHRPQLAARTPRRAHGGTDAGFSLIELMVVLLILAILLAIAIPTYLGTTASADDRSVQSDLVSAFTAAKTQFQNGNQSYDISGSPNAVALASALEANDLQLSFKAGSLGPTVAQGSSGAADDISVSVSADGVGIVLGAFSVPGNCFYIVDNTGPLASAATSAPPYAGTTSVTTTRATVPPGSLALPTAPGTWYVGVAGDTSKDDCNAATPASSGTNVMASYQRNGFPH